MKTEKEAKEEVGMIGMLLLMGWMLFMALFSSGCAGEIYLGARRIDEVQQTQVMKDKPLICLFTRCSAEDGAK